MAESRIVVAIDGPAGAGKSTLARMLARDLEFTYIDSGAMYRVLGVLARERGIPLTDGTTLAALAARLRFAFPFRGEELRVVVDDRDMSEAIRTPQASQDASVVSQLGPVRDALVAAQRRMGRQGDVVMEGRDIGTVVFPDAPLKVFLTATSRVRGLRRWEQLKEQGEDADLAEVIAAIEERDLRDSTRAVSPLKPADDALVVDTSQLGIPRVRGILQRLVAAAREGRQVDSSLLED